jgi:protein-S-isoprenylcysteine O-methyltransferase Ste14
MSISMSKPIDPSKKAKQPDFFFYRLRKLRLWFAWPFVLGVVVYAQSSATGFWAGIPIIALGEAIRIWSHGYLRKTRKLATSGPYGYVRNPLYLGNFLIGLGFCVIMWHPAIVALYTIGFFGVYWVTVKGEEERLVYTFGQTFGDYCKAVRRFLPRLTPYRGGRRRRFAIHRVWGHGEEITIFAICDLILLFFLRQELYQYGNGLTEATLGVILLTAITSAALLFAHFHRRIKGREKYRRYEAYQTRRWRNWQTRKI